MLDFKSRISDPEAFTRICDAITEKRPFSLVRFGDGESMFLGAPNYSGLSHQHQIVSTWFGDVDIPASALQSLKEEVTKAFRNSDIIGAPGLGSLGVFAEANKVLRRVVLNQVSSQNIRLCSAAFAMFLYKNNLFQTLFDCCREINLINGRNISVFLERKFGVKVADFHLIPSEAAWTPYDVAVHFPTRFEELRRELGTPKAGAVYLVGAGICGKVYCDWIKKNGAIALDIGSIFDVWAGKRTRAYIDNNDAFENLKLQFDAVSDQAEAQLDMAENLLRVGDQAAALVHAKRSLEINPRVSKTYLLLSNLHREKGEIASALELLDVAIANGQSGYEIMMERASVLHALGNTDQAIEQYEQTAIELQKSIRSGVFASQKYFYLSQVFEHLGKTDEAIAAAYDGADEDLPNPYSHFQTGIILYRNGLLNQAADKLRVAIHLGKNVAQFHYYLGIVLKQMGNVDDAEIELRQALKLDTANANAHFLLGEIHAVKNRFEDARREVELAVELNPTQAHYKDFLKTLLENLTSLNQPI